jgi:hypothetical protein
MVLAIYLFMDGHNDIYGLGNLRLMDGHNHIYGISSSPMDGHNQIYGLSGLSSHGRP